MSSMQEPEYDPFEIARYCLRYLKPRTNREDWIKVGMACHSVGDGLLPDWLAWSAQADNYKEGEARRQWRSFKSGKVTVGTLVHMAKADGAPWPPPNSAPRQPPKVKPFVPPSSYKGKPLAKLHPYSPTFIRCRWVDDAGEKAISSYTFKQGEWVNKEPEGEAIPLYRASDIGEVGTTVYVVEGEGCADAMATQLQLVAVSSHSSGRGGWMKSNWTALSGYRVVILPDNDETGAKYAKELAEHLRSLAESVTVAPPFDLGHGSDVVDWLDANDSADLGQLLTRLATHVAQGKTEAKPGDFGALLGEVGEELKQTHARGWLGLRLPTFQRLDSLLCGLRGLMLLGAAPGVGKTQLTIQLGMDAMSDPTVGLVYLSLEMRPGDLVKRLLASEAGLTYRRLVLGDQALAGKEVDGLRLNDADGRKVKVAKGRLDAFGKRIRMFGNADIGTLQGSANDPSRWYDKLTELVRTAKEDMGVSHALIVVDNLQAILVEPARGGAWSGDMERDRLIIEGLTRFQQECRDAVLVVSEVAKGQFKDADSMGDLLGTGRNAYRADAVLLMSRAWKYQVDAATNKVKKSADGKPIKVYDKHQVELKIDKGRDGMVRSTVMLTWDKEHGRLTEVAE